MVAYLLVGEMGVGKTTIGKLLATQKGLPYYDGDDVLPQKMRDRTTNGLPLTSSEVDKYVHEHLIPYARQAAVDATNGVVFSQALYNWKHRRLVANILCSSLKNSRRGDGTWLPGVDFKVVRIRPKSLQRHIKILMSRDHGLRWTMSMLASKPWFDSHSITHTVINNSNPQSVVDRECGKWGAFYD